MAKSTADESDVRAVLARRHDNGADYWATKDGRIYVGNPFSTIASLGMLYELGVGATHEAVKGALRVVLDACRDDGHIRVAPSAPLYPCYTAEALRMLCRFGLTRNAAVERTVATLLGASHDSGGWRCNFTRFGKGPETRCANPGATLYVLDALRFFPARRKGDRVVDRAIESLLEHWTTKAPAGPCHWGIGETFMRVEYPFLRYNLFFYVYVLSFYPRARRDARFEAARAALEAKLDASGRVIVESPHRGLEALRFCAKGEPSRAATRRFREIRKNCG